MAKKDKGSLEEPAELLDIRGLSFEDQVRALRKEYEKAYNIWKPYPQVDPRLKEKFRVISKVLHDWELLFEGKL